MKTVSGTAIIRGVIRSLIPVAAVAAVVGLGLGCAGDESEVCQSLQDLQASVQALGDIELEDTSADELQQAANQIVTDANEAQDAADEELGKRSTRSRQPWRPSSPTSRRHPPKAS